MITTKPENLVSERAALPKYVDSSPLSPRRGISGANQYQRVQLDGFDAPTDIATLC